MAIGQFERVTPLLLRLATQVSHVPQPFSISPRAIHRRLEALRTLLL